MVHLKFIGLYNVRLLFFKTSSEVLVDRDEIGRADSLFRRAESKYSVEQVGVIVVISVVANSM